MDFTLSLLPFYYRLINGRLINIPTPCYFSKQWRLNIHVKMHSCFFKYNFLSSTFYIQRALFIHLLRNACHFIERFLWLYRLTIIAHPVM